MIQEKRIELIKQLLEERQELTTKDIMDEFDVSQDTARRDIVLLTERWNFTVGFWTECPELSKPVRTIYQGKNADRDGGVKIF